MARRLHPVHVGCSGWNYTSWRGALYAPEVPQRAWLEQYARAFDTVEVNTTFYRLIATEAVAHWIEQTPPHFIFAVKASRYLTHIKRLANVSEGIARFYARLEPMIAAERLGPVLWQLPENFHRDDERLARALEQLPAGRHAFELRHPSWFAPEVYALLRSRGAALVIGDHPERRFQTYEATAPWRYVRMHYGRRGQRGNYSPRELESWAERLHDWRAAGPIFVYFNNDWEAFAPRDAAMLVRLLAQQAGEAVEQPARRRRAAGAGRRSR